MKSQIKKIMVLSYLLLMCLFLSSCKKGEGEVKKIKDLEFTVVEDADLPDKLVEIINQKKMNPCKFTYSNGNYLYIIQGYGAQKSGGYSISVTELFLTENSVYVKTNLIGPKKDDAVTQTVTYPYVVIKTEFIDKPTLFQ